MNTAQPVLEKIDNRPAIIPVILLPGEQPIYVRREDEADVIALLQGERAMIQEEGEPEVRRVLDLGAREGAFSVYCKFRWPYAWCDSVEMDALLQNLCHTNGPAGTRVNDRAVATMGAAYDLIRVTPGSVTYFGTMQHRAAIVFFDGVQGDLSSLGYKLVACGMRAKHEGFSWWVLSP